MRKQKSVVAILLAVMMIFTFMPTMSFAASTDTAGHTFGDTSGYVDADYEGLKVLVEPTCDTDGVGEITCTTKLNGEDCGAVKTVKIRALGHKGGNRVKMTAAEMMDYFKMTEADKKAWYVAHPNWCEKYAYVCEHCGALVYEVRGTWSAYRTIADVRSTQENPWVAHTKPDGLEKCAETFTCAECGVKDCPVAEADREQHKYNTETRKAHILPGGNDYVEVVSRTCTVCGKVEEPVTTIHRYEDKTINHGATTRREVVSLTPCKNPNGYEDVCNDCGMVVSSGQAPLAAHTYVTSLPYQKANGLMYTKETCVVCGDDKPNSEVAVGFAPTPGTGTITYEAASTPNCEQGSFIVATETSATGAVSRNILSDIQVEDAIAAGTFIKIGDKYYNKDKQTEVPYSKKIGHKFGTMTPVKEANCTDPGFDAKVCTNCGKIDHNTVKTTSKALGHEVKEVVVPAKCGEGGYTYKVCTRCNKYIEKDGKTIGYEEYDETKPVVSLGTKCNYEWKTLEEATPFKLGTRAKVCTVCGDELGATKESVAKTAVAKPGVKVYKGKKKATVTVKAATDAVKYQILVNGKVSKTVTAAGKVNVTKGLKVGKKNTFQIKAFDANDNTAVSAKVTKKIKKK